ncbi:MAG: hypothetical protein SLRJCFUN_000659 [Candidatus Fervidibacter sp.]
MKGRMSLILLAMFVSFGQGQVLIVRDDRWAATAPAARFAVDNQVATAERWLRRCRLPYRRVNASALTPEEIRNALCLLPANMPDPSSLAALQNAQRFVVWAWNGRTDEWRQALATITSGKGRLITEPFPPDRSDGERAAQLAAWLLEGAQLSPRFQRLLRERWSAWVSELRRKRQAWLREITQKPFADEVRRQQALALLRPDLATVSLHLTQDGTVWLKRLRVLLSEHERIHRALAISLEPREGEIRGIWLHTYAPTNWEEVMQTLKAANFNCLFFRAGRGGNVVYRSQFLPRDLWAERADLDELANAAEAAKRYGIELHAWRVNFHFGTAPDWLKEQMAKEDRLVRDPEGKQALWLNPADPRNQEHEFRAMMELLTCSIAGVHFDYIRYPEAPHYRFDYSEVSRRQFEQATGIALSDFPRQVLLGPLKLRYDEWQRENVTNLVRRVYFAVKDANPQIAVSAAVWQRHRYYFALIKQDWMRWVREGILDFVCPMDYTADTSLFAERVKEQVTEVNGTVPIAPGIGAYLLDDEWQFLEQVKVARDLGADGFVVFSYNIAPLRDFLAALTLGATAQPTVPAHRAPRFVFHLSNGLRHKDMPITYRAGDAVHITATVTMGLLPADKVASVRFALRWEREEGFAEATLMEGELTAEQLRKGATLRCTARVPKGIVRLVARGIVTFADGTTQPFVRRGPFVRGLPSNEFAAVLRSLLPVKLPSKTPRPAIGVIADGWHAERLTALLQRQGYTAFLVRYLLPTYWQPADVLVIPPLRDLRELTFERAQALRSWVAQGGRVLLLSEACGFHAHANLFPEVAEVIEEHRQVAVRWQRRLVRTGLNALALRPVNNADVLMSTDGNALLVRGKFGRGIVTFWGLRMPLTDDAPEWQAWTPLFCEVVRRALRW